MKKFLLAILTLILLSSPFTHGQKKILSTEDYKKWSSINNQAISDDGNWVAYDLTFNMAGDDDPDERKLFVKRVDGKKEYEIPLGSQARFSDDSKWVAYFVAVSNKESKKLKDQKLPVTRKAELLNMATSEKTTWENVSWIGFSKGSLVIGIQKTALDEKKSYKGNDVIFRDLLGGYDHFEGSVVNFLFSKSGSHVAYIRDASDKTGNGIYLMNLITGSRLPIEQDSADYSGLTWDKNGTAVAAYKSSKKTEGKGENLSVVLITNANSESPEKQILSPDNISEFLQGMEINIKAKLSFNVNSTMLFFGTKKSVGKEEKNEAEKEKKADLDVWHWKDKQIQSVQRMRANREKNKGFRCVYHLDSKKFVQLCDETIENIQLTRDGKWGIVRDDMPYFTDYKEKQADFYRVTTSTGQRDLIIKGLKRQEGLSPDSKYFLYWKDAQMWVYNFSTGTSLNLTKTAPVSFVNQEFDYPTEKPSYGIAGYTKDGKAVIIRTRYDLWYQPLDGSTARNLTASIGTEREIKFTPVILDKDELFIDLTRPILLSAYGQWTKKSGYFRLSSGEPGVTKPEELIWVDKRIRRLNYAKNTGSYLFSMESFVDPPNLFVSDGSFKNRKQVSNCNEQQKEYIWGHSILFDFTNSKGVRLQGWMAIPDTWKEGQKLPMMVSFYEKSSQNLHRYLQPVYASVSGQTLIEAVSRGYLVMQPDIHFNTGATGDDILECVEAATKKVIEMGYADPEKIGVAGFSFSGYGTSYIASRSTMFKAAFAGAGVINLVSDFNHLWGYSQDRKKGTGLNAQDYYINTQQRMGANPHDDHELYRDQSPVTHVKTMTIPLLILQGESDNTVAWIEAIEMYNAMRFNGKDVILLSYADEPHGLYKRENQIDLHQRTFEYYDHYLKGEPAADWIKNGIRFLDKEK
jgi:esterase/lipase